MDPLDPDDKNEPSWFEAKTRALQGGLTELELDALAELVNIGVSRAANSLREMIGEEVLLTVPALAILSREEAAVVVGQGKGHPLIAVRQAFHGEFSGSALLIFPEPNSLELVRAVTRGELSLDDIIELEQEALAEIGNIILNGCMATIANLLERGLTMSLPEIVRGSGLDFFDLSPSGEEDRILFVRINFSLKGREISGYVAIVMDFLSLSALRALVADFIQREAG
jgi:chemotaxis protein CheC